MAKRVYFGFHYEDVETFRANVVRNHWLTKEDREDAGFFDASLWESAQRTGVEAVKRLIDGGLENTTSTVILIGSQTYDRRYVRYEIARSIQRGNGLLGVHINGIKDKFSQTKSLGPNPFEYLSAQYSSDGTRLYFLDWSGNQWKSMQDLSGYGLAQPRPQSEWGQSYQLTRWYKTYDWIRDDGYNNFANWIG